MVEGDNDQIEVKCIFCGKSLDRPEMVRYRGAIACNECADKQKSRPEPILRPFFFLAGIGSLIGMITFIYFTFDVTLFSQIEPETYIQPLVPFFGGLLITIAFVSLGLYAINRVHLFIASIVGLLVGTIAAVANAFALYDFVVDGPYFVIEMITYTKTISYYSSTLAAYSLFTIIAALAILLHMANIKTEYVSIALAGLFLLSSTIVISIWTWIIAGFLNALVYAVAFVFFVTRRRIYEEEPIQPL